MDCKELILTDIIGVDIYLADDTSISIPPIIPIQSLAASALTLPSSPACSIRLDDDSADIAMNTPTIKASNSRDAQGNIFKHDVQLPVYIGHDKAQEITSALQGHDFHLIYIKADGSKTLGYALPNTAYCDIELSPVYSATSTLKIVLQSMSAFIPIADDTSTDNSD